MQNVLKTLQAAGVLIRAERATGMNYMRLLKLLYIADRESLRECGRPITGDRTVAMKRGPVLSGTLNLIKGEHGESHLWQDFFEKQDYRVQLLKNPDISELSKFEIRLLQRIADKYRLFDEWDLVEETHTFSEWEKNYQANTSTNIPVADILEGVGRNADKDAILEQLEERRKIDQFFQQPHPGVSVGPAKLLQA
jgi:uncharacterized phage-associated protein